MSGSFTQCSLRGSQSSSSIIFLSVLASIQMLPSFLGALLSSYLTLDTDTCAHHVIAFAHSGYLYVIMSSAVFSSISFLPLFSLGSSEGRCNWPWFRPVPFMYYLTLKSWSCWLFQLPVKERFPDSTLHTVLLSHLLFSVFGCNLASHTFSLLQVNSVTFSPAFLIWPL